MMCFTDFFFLEGSFIISRESLALDKHCSVPTNKSEKQDNFENEKQSWRTNSVRFENLRSYDTQDNAVLPSKADKSVEQHRDQK